MIEVATESSPPFRKPLLPPEEDERQKSRAVRGHT